VDIDWPPNIGHLWYLWVWKLNFISYEFFLHPPWFRYSNRFLRHYRAGIFVIIGAIWIVRSIEINCNRCLLVF
jgi:hypothetical protein